MDFDRVRSLAAIEHALIVECLTVHVAFGAGLRSEPPAEIMNSLALTCMFRLRALHDTLSDAGEPSALTRATEIGAISLVPAGGTDLTLLVQHERQIAVALGRAWAGVTDLPVDLPHPFIAGVDALEAALTGSTVPPARREAADDAEQGLLDLSDRSYGLVVGALDAQFQQSDFLVAGAFRQFAVSAMSLLDEANRSLARHHLLPPFTG